MMFTIMLIRHGETEWNKTEIFRGRADVELNENGLKQAQLLAEYLAEEKINAIYSSPLKRALKTAEKIAGFHNLKVNIAPELIDFDYGEWQGLTHEMVKVAFKELYELWQNSPQRVHIPQAEDLDSVKKRTLSLVAKLIAENQGVVVLVSHRVINKVLICALLGLDNSHFWDIKVDTCGITTFIYQHERFKLDKHNDTSFLKCIGGNKLNDF